MVEHSNHWSLNYEGGKIVRHAKESPYFIGYSNIQISMDAPFLGRVANEIDRRNATGSRVETAYKGYSDKNLKRSLGRIFGPIAIKSAENEARVVIQIARGTSALNMQQEVILPVLKQQNVTNREIHYGYRSADYFTPPRLPFLLVNIGMIANLTEALPVGSVCIPAKTYDVVGTQDGLDIVASQNHDDDLSSNLGFTATNLFGIQDSMPFVTPSNYPNGKQRFDTLIARAQRQW